jgi:hypothetical protein
MNGIAPRQMRRPDAALRSDLHRMRGLLLCKVGAAHVALRLIAADNALKE